MGVEGNVSVDSGPVDGVAKGTFFGLLSGPGIPLFALGGCESGGPESGKGAEEGSHCLLTGRVGVGWRDSSADVVASAIVTECVVADRATEGAEDGLDYGHWVFLSRKGVLMY